MAKIFKSIAAELVRENDLRRPALIPASPHAGNRSHNNKCCNICESPKQLGVLKRREILVASTSVRMPVTEFFLRPRDQVSSLTDYHILQNAQKLKFKHASDVDDVASPFPSSDDEPYNGHPVEVGVSRRAFSEEESPGRQEEVVIEGIKVKRETPLLFDVYIRGEEKNEDCYCGSFIHMPPRGHLQKRRTRKRVAWCSLRLGIGHLMENMNAQRRTSVMVKLVPRLKMDGNPITVQSIRIDYS